MKVALPWTSGEEKRDIPCEYNITFINKPELFDNLIDFLSWHPQDRFNIKIEDYDEWNREVYSFDFSKLQTLTRINPNIYIRLTADNAKQYQLLKELGVNFFFDTHAAAINYRTLEELASLGVTDVYIGDDLCYDLKNVRKACDKLGVSLRWVLDEIPGFAQDRTTNPRAPWVTPENINELDQYVDTFEFSEQNSWAKLNTLYKIWFIKKRWRENLRALYPELEIDVWNQSMSIDLLKYRFNCRCKCIFGSVCKKCSSNIEIANNLYTKGFAYDLPKEEE